MSRLVSNDSVQDGIPRLPDFTRLTINRAWPLNWFPKFLLIAGGVLSVAGIAYAGFWVGELGQDWAGLSNSAVASQSQPTGGSSQDSLHSGGRITSAMSAITREPGNVNVDVRRPGRRSSSLRSKAPALRRKSSALGKRRVSPSKQRRTSQRGGFWRNQGRTVARRLGRDGIVATVKSNIPSLGPCLKGARAKGEIGPGQHQLVLEWTIGRNGRAHHGRVLGPSEIVASKARMCIARQIGRWQFGRVAAPTPVRNFPVAIRLP